MTLGAGSVTRIVLGERRFGVSESPFVERLGGLSEDCVGLVRNSSNQR